MIYLNIDPERPEALFLDTFLTAQKNLRFFFQKLPKEIEDLAYEFRDLVMRRGLKGEASYEMKETVRTFSLDPKYKWISGHSVDRKFTIKVQIETHSVYHNDTETERKLVVWEDNVYLSSPNINILPWDREKK